MKAPNYFITLLKGYNRAASNFAPTLPTWIAVISLVIYHLQRAGTFLFSAQETPSLGTTVNRAITQIIKIFQIRYLEQITPLNYEGITIILFSLIIIGVLVKVRFFILERTREQKVKRESISALFQLAFVSWALVFEKYFLYIPVLENSFYVFTQPGVKAYILTLAIFNLTCMLIFRILQCVFLFWNPYTNLKCIPRGITGELIDIIGFLIMYATKNASSNISIYMGLALTVLQFVCLFLAPKFVDGIQNQVELVFQVFCFALGIDILLQHHIYHTQDFPFLLMAAFIYWGLRSLLRYRFWSLLRQFENPDLSKDMVRSLPLIFDRYFGSSSLLDSIYPILTYRSNLENNKNFEDIMIFSKEDCSLEKDLHKQKAFPAFITFIETIYKEYIQATDITKPFLQPIIVAYLFFVKRVLKDHDKALILLSDFRIKFKRMQISMNLREKIQLILIEEECLKEITTSKGNYSLDVAQVFFVLDKTEELRLRIIHFIEKKLEFLDSLKEPSLDLNLIKSTGVVLTKEIQALLKTATTDSDFTHYSKPKELFSYFVKEVLQNPKMLGVEYNNIHSHHSHRIVKEARSKEMNVDELIEKIQGNSTPQAFILIINDCSIARGKIVRYSKQLLTRLNYSTDEASGLNFDDIVAAVNYPKHTFFDEKQEINQDSDRKMCEVILRSSSGDLIPAHGSIQRQVFDDTPCMVLLGEEEEKSNSGYFILCQQDGKIQGISAKLASYLTAYNPLNGKFIHHILSKRDIMPSLLLDEHIAYTRRSGVLKLQNSKNLKENFVEIDFSVCPFGTKDTVSGSRENYVVYLYPVRAGSLKELLKMSSRKWVFSANQVLSPKSIEGYQSDRTPFVTTPNSFAEKNEKFHFTSWADVDRTRFNTKVGSQSTLKPQAYSSKIVEVNLEEESEHSDKTSDRKIKEADEFVSEEEFEDKESGHLPALANQNDSTAYYGSMQGSAKRQRNIEKAKQLIENHKLPVSIRWMRVLQLLVCIAMLVYWMIDYFDLTRKFEILSEMSGITSFPLTLLTIMAAFGGYSEVSLAAMSGLFRADVGTDTLSLVLGMTANLFTTFQTQFKKYVLQSNPISYYSDFTYESYALNLTLPDSPYLNREVNFNEALNTLRGYMSEFFYGIQKGRVDIDSLNFFRQESLDYNRIFQLLSEDLFNRLSAEFDNLLLLLALRVILGVAVAVTIGSSVLYIFFKLHRSSENLLSKFARIPESELNNEIASLREHAAYLQRSEEVVEKKKPGIISKPPKRPGRSGVTISKKFKQLNQRRGLHIFLSIAYCALFLAPFLVAYALKRSPVQNCIPLIKQYKLLAESGAAASAISAHLVEAMLLAANGNPAATLAMLNSTASYIDVAKEASSSLYSMLQTMDHNNAYLSENLTKALQNLRNESFCSTISDSRISLHCNNLVHKSTIVQYGLAAMFKGLIEEFLAYRKQLESAPTLATVAKLTSDANVVYQMFFTTIIHVALADVIALYQSNFEEVAASAHRVFQKLQAVSLVYYCILILLTLTPLLPWARKEYKKVKDIFTLLPTDVLISNPYIIAALRRR